MNEEKSVVLTYKTEYKLKRPKKETILLNLEKMFGFTPSRILLTLAPSRSNAFLVSAIDDKSETETAKQVLKEEKKVKNVKTKNKKL